jgi:hypothetical protein
MSKPTIVACAGAWHSPAIYNKVFLQLRSNGYETVAQSLPSLGGNPPISSFDPDVFAIRETLTKLVVHEEKDVVLVMHSFSGMTGSEAPVGLGKKERQEQGLKGGVVRLVYIAAFVPVEGFNPVAVMKDYPPWMNIDHDVRPPSHFNDDASTAPALVADSAFLTEWPYHRVCQRRHPSLLQRLHLGRGHRMGCPTGATEPGPVL